MLATILTAVLNVLRVLWRAARRVVTTGRWPHFLTGVFFLWYVIKTGPEKILQGVGRALVWGSKGIIPVFGALGKAIIFPFVILWKIARFILALPFWLLGCLLAGLILFHFTPFGNDYSASFWALLIVGSIALFAIAGWIKGGPNAARWFIGGLATVCAFALVFIFLALAARVLVPSFWVRIETRYTRATQGSTREGIEEGAKNILGDAYNSELDRRLADIQRMREAGGSPESIKILVEALEKRKAEVDRATSPSPIQPPQPTPTASSIPTRTAAPEMAASQSELKVWFYNTLEQPVVIWWRGVGVGDEYRSSKEPIPPRWRGWITYHPAPGAVWVVKNKEGEELGKNFPVSAISPSGDHII